jgi:hypothetical protein
MNASTVTEPAVSGELITIPGGGDIHIHTYTDLKLLVRELASREGRKIIVDTIKGNKIDLGM